MHAANEKGQLLQEQEAKLAAMQAEHQSALEAALRSRADELDAEQSARAELQEKMQDQAQELESSVADLADLRAEATDLLTSQEDEMALAAEMMALADEIALATDGSSSPALRQVQAEIELLQRQATAHAQDVTLQSSAAATRCSADDFHACASKNPTMSVSFSSWPSISCT